MLDKLFTEATQAHSINDLDLAENLYLKILNKYPRESKTLFLIGTLYIQKKIYSKAIQYLLDSLSIDSENDHILMNLGVAYKENQNFEESEKMFTQSLLLNPQNTDALNNLGSLYLNQRKYDFAIKYFKQAVAISPKNDSYTMNLAKALACMGDFKKSIHYLLQINSSSKYFFESQVKLFNIFFKSKNYENCITLGTELIKKQLNLDTLSSILHNLIHAAIELGDSKKAKSFFLKLSSNDGNYLFNKALIDSAEGAIDEAISGYKTLIKDKKNQTQSLHNLGLIYSRRKEITKAINSFKDALNINPNLLDTRKILGMLQLSQCDFKLGWPNFLSYTETAIYGYPFLKNKTIWKGQKVDKPILIMLDQGIGDQIFYASMLNRLDASNRYICTTDTKLKELFTKSFSKSIQFTSQDKVSSVDFDFYVRGSHLAEMYIQEKSDLKQQMPYLKANKFSFKDKKIIGISWHSNNKFIGRYKSIHLDVLVKKLKTKTHNFMNLQYGDFKNEIKEISINEQIKFIGTRNIDNFNDIMGLSGLIMACDEIYTISNTTAHLAAALGVKVNLLLPHDHHANTWYWFNDSHKKSLWYPNVNVLEAKPGTMISTSLDLIK